MDQTTSPGNRDTVKGKLLRRRAFVREKEYKKLAKQALACGYHRTSWIPITYKDVHQEMMWRVLYGDEFKEEVFFSTREERLYSSLTVWKRDMLPVIDQEEKFMRIYINWLKDSKQLYNPQWKDWSWAFDDGMVKIRWYNNRPYDILGIATLERDY